MQMYVYTPYLVQTSVTIPDTLGCLDIYGSGASDLSEFS